MNCVSISNVILPILIDCDLYAASEPFYHADRTVDFNVLIYVIEGTIYVTEDKTDYAIGSGELLFLKSGVHHFGKHEIPKGTRWYYVHFLFNETYKPNDKFCESLMKLPKELKRLSETYIEKSIAELISYCGLDDAYKEWNKNTRLFELLKNIAFYDSITKIEPSLSDKICFYLQKNIGLKFSARELEREFYLSYKHMAAQFKKQTGFTMQQYHTQIKMNEACRLLKSTLFSIKEISQKLGYDDMLYFSKCFHRYLGCSPTLYRKTAVRY